MHSIYEIERKGLLDIGHIYANAFRGNSLSLKTIGISQCQRDILSSIYYILVKEQKCVPIEHIDNDAKIELWTEAKINCKELSEYEMKKYCRAIWALEHIL